MYVDSTKSKIDLIYDEKKDILYGWLGNVVPSIPENHDWIIIRKEIDTNKAVGFVIYSYNWKKEKGMIKDLPYFKNVVLP